MAEPKKRMTSSRSGGRQSHDAISEKSLIKCSHCKQPVEPHMVCKNCGYYHGKKIVETSTEIEKAKKVKEELKDE